MRFRTRPYPHYEGPPGTLAEASRRVDESWRIRAENLEAIRNAARLRLAIILGAPFAGLVAGLLLAWLGHR